MTIDAARRVDDPVLAEFVAEVEASPDPADYPSALGVVNGAVVYEAAALRRRIADSGQRVVLDELATALADGPGLIAIRGAVDAGAVDAVSVAFDRIIEDERAATTVHGDHFGKPGANDRVWNALEKLAVAEPDAFVAYYASDMIALGALAWLGPHYQVTSQVNVVNPGGAAQMPHRDYHLGFMTDAAAATYPRHAHRMSPALTLQGAVAHGPTPVESGPTKYLPNSQRYELGYLAWRRPEFIDYFEAHYVQLPLDTGDLVYFNPALFHAAGHNRTTGVRRMANLLQVNSAFGRAMESIDRLRMSLAVYPALQRARHDGADEQALWNAVAACAEGYAFPSNLDRDQPVDRLTGESQAEVVWAALLADAPVERLAADLADHAAKRVTG